MSNPSVLEVKKDLCIGCGLCLRVCRWGAISISYNQAHIDQTKCNICYNCLLICPRGAIVKLAPVSGDLIETTINILKARTDSIMARIEEMQNKRPLTSGASEKTG